MVRGAPLLEHIYFLSTQIYHSVKELQPRISNCFATHNKLHICVFCSKKMAPQALSVLYLCKDCLLSIQVDERRAPLRTWANGCGPIDFWQPTEVEAYRMAHVKVEPEHRWVWPIH